MKNDFQKKKKNCRVRVGQIFHFMELILFFKTYLGGGLIHLAKQLDPSSCKADQENDQMF
jgi:hypothetical protein